MEATQADILEELDVSMLHAATSDEPNAVCGAACGSRSDERQSRRNGNRRHAFSTRLGELELAIPELRSGTGSPSRHVFTQPDHGSTHEARGKAVARLRAKCPAAATTLEEGGYNTLTYMTFAD